MRLCSNTACDNDQKKTKPPYNLHAKQYFLTGQAEHVQLILHCKQFVKGMRSSIKFELNYDFAYTTVINFWAYQPYKGKYTAKPYCKKTAIVISEIWLDHYIFCADNFKIITVNPI